MINKREYPIPFLLLFRATVVESLILFSDKNREEVHQNAMGHVPSTGQINISGILQGSVLEDL